MSHTVPVPVILLVEDEESDAFFMRRAFERAGVQPVLQVVEDGRSAIDYLAGAGRYSDRANFPLPDLVLLDLKLPYVSGIEVLQWIRSRPEFRDLIVLVLTSSAEPADRQAAERAGSNGYFVKPASPTDLVKTVKAIEAFWLPESSSPSAQLRGPS